MKTLLRPAVPIPLVLGVSLLADLLAFGDIHRVLTLLRALRLR